MASYRVYIRRFRCYDETGPDWLGSDEVRFAGAFVKGDEKVTTAMTPKYGDVDTGDRRTTYMDILGIAGPNTPPWRTMKLWFAPQHLLEIDLPEVTPAGGCEAPLSIIVSGIEVDNGDGADLEPWVQLAGRTVEGALAAGGIPIQIPEEAKTILRDALADRSLGWGLANLDQDRLDHLDPGDVTTVRVRLTHDVDPGDIFLTNGGDYSVDLLVERLD